MPGSKNAAAPAGPPADPGPVDPSPVGARRHLGGRYDVAVVGGGVTGCATAYHLARAGSRVVLLERFEIGTEASGRNAGSLHGQIQSVSFNERGASWARSFLPALAFVIESLSLWRGLSDELGVDLEVKANGGLLVVDELDQMRRVEEKVAIEREGGLDARLLSRDELMRLAPYVARTMIGAEYSPVEGKVNSMLAAPAFARKAGEAGADIRTRVTMLGLEPTSQHVRLVTEHGEIHADQVVLASGNQLSAQAASLGARLPISNEPVQVAATEPVEPLVEHLVYYAGAPLTLKQARAGTLLIGGGWPARTDPQTGYPRVDLSSLRSNLAVALHVAPVIGNVLVLRSWAGIGTATPDERPVIGRLAGVPRVLVGVFPYLGLTAGPLMGRVLADLALGRDAGLDLEPFRPDRFSE
jgi:sarcosine oxidase, subunit beta